jgi:hypothetical protein
MSMQEKVSMIYRKMAPLFKVDRDKIMANVKSRLPDLQGRSPSIDLELAQVRTYVDPEKPAGVFTVPSVVVLSFATNWGIVVGGTLYHLTVQNDGHAEFSGDGLPPIGKDFRIEFRGVSPAKGKIVESRVVGETKYDHEQLLEIGAVLIESFRSRHHLFWNCQVFAECFLNIIPTGVHLNSTMPIV